MTHIDSRILNSRQIENYNFAKLSLRFCQRLQVLPRIEDTPSWKGETNGEAGYIAGPSIPTWARLPVLVVLAELQSPGLAAPGPVPWLVQYGGDPN